MTISRRGSNSTSPYPVDHAEDFGEMIIGDQYAAQITVYPSGNTNNMWADMAPDAPLIGIRLKLLCDPTGSGESIHRTIKTTLSRPFEERWCRDEDELKARKDKIEGEFEETVAICSKGEDFEEIFLEMTHVMRNHCSHRYRMFVTIQISVPSLTVECTPGLKRIEQQRSMYENSKKYGDILLKIVCDDNNSCGLEEPPSKRRRKQEDLGSDSDSLSGSSPIVEETSMTMRASGVILRSASSVFESMLGNDMKEKEEKVIEIHAANMKDVDDMLYYVIAYDLRADVNPLSLIKLAHLYQLTALFDACCSRIVDKLDTDNFVESANIFHRFEIKEGYDKVVEFGQRNYESIKDLESFKNLSFAFKYGLIESQKKARNSD